MNLNAVIAFGGQYVSRQADGAIVGLGVSGQGSKEESRETKEEEKRRAHATPPCKRDESV